MADGWIFFFGVMARNASLFLGLRYLKQKSSFVSVITLISVCGVMLGVAVMMIVMAIFKGFLVEYRAVHLGFEPHLLMRHRVEPGLESGESGWRELRDSLAEVNGVKRVVPVVLGNVVLDAGGDLQGMEVLGMRSEDGEEGLVERLRAHLKEGEFDLDGDSIVLTDGMVKKLGVKLGDLITVNSVKNLEQMVQSLERLEGASEEEKQQTDYDEVFTLGEDLEVVGILREDTAGARGYMPMHLAQSLLALEDEVTGLNVELEDAEMAPEMEVWLYQNDLVPLDWGSQTWLDGAEMMLRNVENQQSLLYFLLLFIVLVAAICVMNTTITVSVQKRREIGVLTALGARRGQIMGIFLVQALVVALLGVILGLLTGALVLDRRNAIREWIAELTGKDFFPQEIYFLSSIPAHVALVDVVAVCGMALTLCLAAALIPAWVAARVDPAVALRD
jgi:lipoprotein-releasing system permease protein